jgi:asparagine synthase (glutamine-hydrolysing)
MIVAEPAERQGWATEWLAGYGAGDVSGADGFEPVMRGELATEAGGFSGARQRRLSLRAAPGSAWPSSAESGGCRVIYDGVLYNHSELSHELGSSAGPQSTDAQLILAAYLRWGENLVHRIKGIFALIIWDSGQDLLLCARDAFGFHPLFFAETRRGLLLSTSVKALSDHPDVTQAINRAAVADRLWHRMSSNQESFLEETFLANVFRVRPGHVMRVGRGGRRSYRYWDPAPPGQPIRWVTEEELEGFEGLLAQAVERCMGPGRPGIFLSGGLDSVCVASVAADLTRESGRAVPLTLSLGFPDPECNEEQVQRGVAQALGLPQVLMPFNDAVSPEGLLLRAIELSREYPLPLQHVWWPAYEPLALEGKRHGCTTILTGGGGDEWLTVGRGFGIDLLRAGDLRSLLRLWRYEYRTGGSLPRVLRKFWQHSARPLLEHAWATSGLRRASVGLAVQVAPQRMEARRQARRLSCIERTLPSFLAPDQALRHELFERAYQDMATTPPLHESFYMRDAHEYLEHPFLTWTREEYFELGRRVGMPIREPFWDADLADFLYRLPPFDLLKDGASKGIVRERLARRFPQLGFAGQKKVWAGSFYGSLNLREGVRAWEALGGTPALAHAGIVDSKLVGSLIQQILGSGQSEDAYRVLELLALEAWVRPRL